jgi:hypothetical protein
LHFNHPSPLIAAHRRSSPLNAVHTPPHDAIVYTDFL